MQPEEQKQPIPQSVPIKPGPSASEKQPLTDYGESKAAFKEGLNSDVRGRKADVPSLPTSSSTGKDGGGDQQKETDHHESNHKHPDAAGEPYGGPRGGSDPFAKMQAQAQAAPEPGMNNKKNDPGMSL